MNKLLSLAGALGRIQNHNAVAASKYAIQADVSFSEGTKFYGGLQTLVTSNNNKPVDIFLLTIFRLKANAVENHYSYFDTVSESHLHFSDAAWQNTMTLPIDASFINQFITGQFNIVNEYYRIQMQGDETFKLAYFLEYTDYYEGHQVVHNKEMTANLEGKPLTLTHEYLGGLVQFSGMFNWVKFQGFSDNEFSSNIQVPNVNVALSPTKAAGFFTTDVHVHTVEDVMQYVNKKLKNDGYHEIKYFTFIGSFGAYYNRDGIYEKGTEYHRDNIKTIPTCYFYVTIIGSNYTYYDILIFNPNPGI